MDQAVPAMSEAVDSVYRSQAAPGHAILLRRVRHVFGCP